MIKTLSFFSVVLLFSFKGFTNTDPLDIYKADLVKEDLKKDAYSVKRLHNVEMNISGPDKMRLYKHEVTTILSEKGSDHLVIYHSSSKLYYLEDVEVKLYDKNGVLLEKYKKKDFYTQAEIGEFVPDGFLFYKKLVANSYPVTIEEESTYRINWLFKFPRFQFTVPNQSIESASLRLTFPSSMKVNYKAYNFIEKPKLQTLKNEEVVEFHIGNLPVKKYGEETRPHIYFNADKIEHNGYAGNTSTWTDMGLWYNNVVKGRNTLTIEHQEEIRKLVMGASSDREKVRILYEYLQRNFRYVSIQLGIGGVQPFPADFLHEKKYGDCKGLSNYMEACLAALNIKSYSAWIHSGVNETYMDTSFAHDVFNHQILMVPLNKDTIWLECTSNVHEFGHLGTSTENRFAVVLTENGGKLVKTPTSKYTDNTIYSYTDININVDGEGEVDTRFFTTGEFKYEMVGISRQTIEEQKKFAVLSFGLSNSTEFEMNFGNREEFPYTSKIKMEVDKIYDFKAGSKLFLRPRLNKMWLGSLTKEEKPEYNFYLRRPMTKTDTTVFHLPEGYTVEALPRDKTLSFAKGKYESKYWYDEASRTIFSTAKLTVTSQIIEPSIYEEARLFFDQVIDDANQKVVCKKTN